LQFFPTPHKSGTPAGGWLLYWSFTEIYGYQKLHCGSKDLPIHMTAVFINVDRFL